MPVPIAVLPLPEIEGLPPGIRRVAEHFIYRSPSPDHLFLLAEALAEAVNTPRVPEALVIATTSLADELRRRAPEYA